jgi:hypothetical protein
MEDYSREPLIKGERCWRSKDFSREPLIKGAKAARDANAGRTPHIERSLVVASHGLYCFSQRLPPNIFPLLIANCSLGAPRRILRIILHNLQKKLKKVKKIEKK